MSGADEVKFHRGLPQNVWNTEEIEFTVPAGATETGVELRLFGTGILYWDDVSVVKVVDNIVNNGSFEDGTAHWNKKGNESGTLVADTAVKNLGAASLKMTSDGGTLSAVQTLQLTPGYRYEVSVCYNGTGFADESHAELVLKYAGVSGKDVVREIRPVNQGLWYQDVFSFVVPADAAELELRLYGAGTMYWDDVTICRQDNLIQNGGFEDRQSGSVSLGCVECRRRQLFH